MGKTVHLICVFILVQLLFACATTEIPQKDRTQVKDTLRWQTESETTAQNVVGIDFRNGRLVNNVWILDLYPQVELKQKLMQQKIEYVGTKKPLTLDLVVAETKCTLSQSDCSDSSFDWHTKPGEVEFAGFTGTTKKVTVPYHDRYGQISAKLQVKQKQKIATIPLNWHIDNGKILVDLKPALEASPFEPEKAILKVELNNGLNRFSDNTVFGQYIFNLLNLSAERWQKPDKNIQQWLTNIAECIPVSDFDCAIAYMLKIEESGESVPSSYYYHLAAMFLMSGDSDKASAYAQKYLATSDSAQYQHQARAML